MDEYRKTAQKVQQALNQDAAFIQPDPFLAQRVLSTSSKKRIYKKSAVILAVVWMLILTSLTAFAAVLLAGHDVKLYEGAELVNLLPDQFQEYDICHRIRQGYVIGGFHMEDDYIAPMDEHDSIALLDENFRVKWTLTDPRLEGCLLDQIAETEDAVYMGLETSQNGWRPALIKIGMDGAIKWLYSGNGSVDLNDFVVDSHGTSICVGSSEAEGTQKPYILLIDSDGATVEEKRVLSDWPIDSLAAIRLCGEGAQLAGYGDRLVWIGEMAADGRITWQESIEVDETIQTLRLQVNDDGNTVLSVVYSTPSDDASKHIRYYVVTR